MPQHNIHDVLIRQSSEIVGAAATGGAAADPFGVGGKPRTRSRWPDGASGVASARGWWHGGSFDL